LLAEFGFIVPTGLFHVRQRAPALLERAADELPLAFRHSAAMSICAPR
jgi:hypothetical protein